MLKYVTAIVSQVHYRSSMILLLPNSVVIATQNVFEEPFFQAIDLWYQRQNYTHDWTIKQLRETSSLRLMKT